eukprot:jgi/Picre1/35864/NNA_003323.t1
MNNCLVRGERLVDIVKLGHPVLAIQLCTWMGEQKPHFPDVRDCSDNSTHGLHTLAFTHNIVRPVDQEIQRPLFEYFSLPFYQERLERLDLSGNKICPDNLRILLHLGEFHKLKKLRLQDCGLHEAHAQMFLDCCAMPQLKHLDLSLNKLGTQVSLYYLSCSHQLTSQLELLDISAQWYFHDDALAGFSFAADPWTSLKELNLEETGECHRYARPPPSIYAIFRVSFPLRLHHICRCFDSLGWIQAPQKSTQDLGFVRDQ